MRRSLVHKVRDVKDGLAFATVILLFIGFFCIVGTVAAQDFAIRHLGYSNPTALSIFVLENTAIILAALIGPSAVGAFLVALALAFEDNIHLYLQHSVEKGAIHGYTDPCDQWCQENCLGNWARTDDAYRFRLEEDAVHFKMTFC